MIQRQIDVLRSDIVRLGAMVTEVLPRATDAILAGSMSAAREVIENDDRLDALSLDIEERCYQVLTLQQPVAGDLRGIVTALRLTSELERDGDLAANIAKAARRIYGVEIDPVLRGFIQRMSEVATRLTKLSIDAYAESDSGLATALADMDDELDDLHEDYILSLFESRSGSQLEIQPAVQLALVGRYYERIGDHAVNIGERVSYMVTGWMPEHAGAARERLRLEHRTELEQDEAS